MGSVFLEGGEMIPVTFLQVLTMQVLQTKNKLNYGYNSLVVSIGEEVKEKRLTKPIIGQFKEGNLPLRKKIMELSWDGESDYFRGKYIRFEELFQEGERVKIQGISRGMGFTGAIKRWNFATSPKTHGSGYPHRFQGSLESGRGGRSPQKVWKGKKMSGHSGNARRTILNLKIIKLDPEKELLLIKGSCPGRIKSLVRVRSMHRVKEIKKENLMVLNN